jgi:hypothetical protein
VNKPSDSLRAKFSISLINETIKGKKKEKKRRKKGEKKREKKVKLPIVFKKKIDINLSRKTYTEPIRTRTMGRREMSRSLRRLERGPARYFDRG